MADREAVYEEALQAGAAEIIQLERALSKLVQAATDYKSCANPATRQCLDDALENARNHLA